MRVRSVLVLSVVAVLLVATAAQATPLYQFVVSPSTTSTTPGSTVNVTVSLQQLGGTELTLHGLVNTGVSLFWSDSPEPASPSMVLTTPDVYPDDYPGNVYNANTKNITPNATFGSVWDQSTYPTDPGGTYSDIGYAQLTEGNFAAIKASTILLGTFTFTAGGPGTTLLRATDYDPTGDDNVTPLVSGAPIVLDSLIADGTASITVTPEPSTLVLSAIAALGFLGLRLRRKAA